MRNKFVFHSIVVSFFIILMVSSLCIAEQTGSSLVQQEIGGVDKFTINYARSDLGSSNLVEGFHMDLKPNHVRGARIYDDFVVELDKELTLTEPNGLLLRATPTDPLMPAPSIADGWRCSHCHGYNYKGGIYTFQNDATPNLFESIKKRNLDEDYIVKLLMFGFNVFDGTTHTITHEYSLKMDIQSMVDVADFLVNEIYDVDEYIRKTNNESVINHMPSMFIYKGAVDPLLDPVPAAVRINGANFTCTECHGRDGRLMPNIDLYEMSWTNPYKWLHRVNFGTPRSQATYSDIIQEDATIHPGVYEVLMTKGLHFGGARNTAEILEYVQTHFKPTLAP